MKRELLQNIIVQPYISGASIDRQGFLSGVLGINVAAPTGSPSAAQIALTVTESNDNTAFTPITDALAILGDSTLPIDTAEGLNANIDLDLVGLKQYVKITAAITFTGGTSPAAVATYALALGDKNEQPV
jgi:hypothetical protein